jgi:hypothetical protein
MITVVAEDQKLPRVDLIQVAVDALFQVMKKIKHLMSQQAAAVPEVVSVALEYQMTVMAIVEMVIQQRKAHRPI